VDLGSDVALQAGHNVITRERRKAKTHMGMWNKRWISRKPSNGLRWIGGCIIVINDDIIHVK